MTFMKYSLKDGREVLKIFVYTLRCHG